MRVLEPEAMMSKEEARAYDRLARQYLQVLHAGFIETIINMSAERGVFLDVGTGTGWIAIGVAEYAPDVEVIGVDMSPAMMEIGRENAAQRGVGQRVTFLIGDAKSLPFEDETFDSVFCHNMLHHLPEPEEMVREMVRVVKRDGGLFIRDLKRLSKLETFLHVTAFGLPYNKLMKKEYRDSIRASLSEEEWRALFRSLHLQGARLTKQSVTHMTIERPAKNRRQSPVHIPVPLYLRPFKKLYVSK